MEWRCTQITRRTKPEIVDVSFMPWLVGSANLIHSEIQQRQIAEVR